jgi:hypothetical protein
LIQPFQEGTASACFIPTANTTTNLTPILYPMNRNPLNKGVLTENFAETGEIRGDMVVPLQTRRN